LRAKLIYASFTLLAIWSGILTPYVSANEQLPEIAIVIDDIGNQRYRDQQAIRLQGPVAYALLPHTPHARQAANFAAKLGKEIILHIPMEPISHKLPGPGALRLDMEASSYLAKVNANLDAIPNIIGVNNHMGSRLTQNADKMLLLMNEIRKRGNLFFLDSLTTHRSLANNIAQQYNIPSTTRDVFLDHDVSLAAISQSFDRLIQIAKQKGRALAIGHPYPETLEYLEYWLPRLERKGVKLISLSAYIQKEKRHQKIWQASLSRSRQALKN